MKCVKQIYLRYGIGENATDIIMSSWRPNTKKIPFKFKIIGFILL